MESIRRSGSTLSAGGQRGGLGSCSLESVGLPRILLLSRKLLRAHNASRRLLGIGLANCVVADRILHRSDCICVHLLALH